MHIPDGMLPLEFTLSGWACMAGFTMVSLKKIKARGDTQAGVPRAALMTAVFFAGSLIHIPVPPASVHLMLSGLMGILLGWYAVPAILIGLFFQAVMFGHGGLTTLGVNSIIFIVPAMAAFMLTRLFKKSHASISSILLDFSAGAGSVVIAVVLFSTFLLVGLPAHLDNVTEQRAIAALAIAHLPLAVVEGLVAAALLQFLRRVSPEMLYEA